MSIMNMLDYYPIIQKEYATLNDIKLITNCNNSDSYIIMYDLVHECKKKNCKYFINNNNIFIPMTMFIDYFKLNVDRLRRYHNSLSEFF